MFIPQGLRLVHSGSVTQADMKLTPIDAGAMIDVGVDWSIYAGNDAGNTPHLLVLYDSAGKRMQGFIGASGGGLAYGAELITVAADRDFSGGQGNWIVVAGTEVTWDNVDCDWNCTEWNTTKLIISTTLNALHKIVTEISAYTLGSFILYFASSAMGGISGIGVKTHYMPYGGAGKIQYGAASFVGSIDNISIKRVTDISVQGVHLHSTRGGTDRNVASIDNSFDLYCSAGYDFKIYACS